MEKKVSFTLSADVLGDANEAILLGDFNNWNFEEGVKLKVQKNGTLTATVSLEPGQTYEYRYFLSDGRWINDENAEGYSFKQEYQVDNCVITVPAVKAISEPTKSKVEIKPTETKKTTGTKTTKKVEAAPASKTSKTVKGKK